MRIQLKRSSTLLADGSAKPPSSEQMEYGELAVNFNTDDPSVYFKDSDSNIIRISGAGSVGQGTAQMTLDAGPGLYITNPTFTLNQTTDQEIDIELVLEDNSELVGLEFANNKLRAKKATATTLGTIKEPSGIGVYMRQITSSGEQWVSKDATVALPSGYPDLTDGDGSTLDARYLNKNINQTYTASRLTIQQNLTVGNDLDANDINATGTITGNVTGDLTGNADTATNATNAADATNATTAANLTRSVVAGDGLTGGGELTADRTINVAATDSTITVGANGIAVNQSALNFTPAANNGQISINASNGLVATGNNATANQSGDTTRTISGVDATTNVKGVVQLQDSINSTSTTRAATSAAVKLAYDHAPEYAPSKTGSGASGTWGIDITGNAATATVAQSVTGNISTADTATDAINIRVDTQTDNQNRPLVFIANDDNASGTYERLYRDTQTVCYINPSSNTIGAAAFSASGGITAGGTITTPEIQTDRVSANGNLTIQPSGTTQGRTLYLYGGQDDDDRGGSIVIGSSNTGLGGRLYFRGNDGAGSYRFGKPGNSTIEGAFNFSNMTASRTYAFPDVAGTLALTSSKVANSTLLNGYSATSTNTADTVVLRASSGDINCRLVRPEYTDQTTISGAIAYRINNSNDNFIRFCSDKAAIRTFADVPARNGSGASGTWGISITGNAASATNADKLDNVNSTQFLRSDTSDQFTSGTLRFNDNCVLGLGSGTDAELFCNGSHLYLDLNSGIGNFYIRDGTTTRFTFNDNGSFTATSNITAYSDISLKENIETIPNALDKVLALRGVGFNRKDVEDEPRQIGVIAQEVEEVIPEVVITGEEGIKSVAYGNLVGLLIESIKELKAEVDDLKAQLEG